FHNNLGMALERTGHPQAAEEAYAAAIAADPTNEKAASNGERIAAVLKTPDETPVDLAALAQAFVAEIASWEASSVATE
ncbi:MAG TPA: tetratricopeptide repeat protein, partial [Candidatus Krumholzibacteria bacterium]|nr:tetratricopeptide repeat protein [Candidatus Krumholzibacteria bacterium]